MHSLQPSPPVLHPTSSTALLYSVPPSGDRSPRLVGWPGGAARAASPGLRARRALIDGNKPLANERYVPSAASIGIQEASMDISRGLASVIVIRVRAEACHG